VDGHICRVSLDIRLRWVAFPVRFISGHANGYDIVVYQ